MKALRDFRIADAERDFRNAIRIAPRSGIAGLSYYRLGEIEDRFENRPDRAGEDYIRALENLSDSEIRQKASFYLARDLVSQGQLANAFSVLGKLEDGHPSRRILLRATDLSASILEREEHYRQALGLYRMLREKAKREPVGRHAWLKVGLLEGNLGDHAGAARDLKEFLRANPHGPSAAVAEFNLARDLSALGHDRQALALLSDVMGRYSNPDEVNAQIAAVRKKMKEAESHREETTPAPPPAPKK